MMDKRTKMRTAGLILAAGCASRFGGLKQLAPVEGAPLLLRVVRSALSSQLDKTMLVLGFGAELIIGQLGDDLDHPALSVVANRDWQAGMATSIKVGMAHVDQSFDAVVIILGDLPLLSAHIIDQILEAHRTSGKGICLPVREGRWGHPICLSRRYFDVLTKIEGDIGAREIVRENWSQVYQLNIPEDGCFLDVDTRQDMERVKGVSVKHNQGSP
jgi:molybdenum cofactor cytidylyltransferase